MANRSLTLILAATLAGCAPLSAVHPTFGIQGSFSIAQQDLDKLVDSKPGRGLGVFVDFGLPGGNLIRSRLDFTGYEANTWREPGYTEKRQWAQRSLGAEYLYFYDQQPRGFYVAAGLATNSFRQEVVVNGWSSSSDKTRIGFSLGMGYNWNGHWEGNLRYTQTDIDGITLAATNLGVAYRF